jgi:FkbM family methyltransferase
MSSSDEPWGYWRPRGVSAIAISLLEKRIKSRKIRKFLTICGSSARRGTYDVSRFGVNIRCHVEDNHTEKTIVFGNRFDSREEHKLLIESLGHGDIFVDIGANCGLFALPAARQVGPTGRVIAIEPNSEMLRRLRFNISANGFTNLTVVDAAVGDQAGIAQLYLSTSQQGKSGLVSGEDLPSVPVRVETLLQICTENNVNRVDALKIDIEGFEDRALLPFFGVASESLWPRTILIETQHAYRWRQGCLYGLKDAGYRVQWQSTKDALLVR